MKGRFTSISRCGLILLVLATGAHALDFSQGEFAITLDSRLSESAAWRLEKPNPDQIGKLDLDGQQNLCAKDACMSFSGTPDPGPNLRLVHAAGAYSGFNGDQGDLNFKQYDVVAGTTKLDSELSARWHNFNLRVSGTGLFDPVNANLENRNPNTTFQPATSDAPAQSRRLSGRSAILRDAVLSYTDTWQDRNYSIAVGQQTVHWGESSYIALNSLNEINPPDERLYHLPGVRLNQIFQPVPLVKLNTDLFDGASLEALYQLQWKPVVVDQPGTFYSDKNFVGDRDPLDVSFSQVPLDPNQIGHVPGIPTLISSSTTTVRMSGQKDHDPSDGGQYGLHLTYFAQSLNGGTEFGAYYLRYNSRLPAFSIDAASQSCLHDMQDTGSPTLNTLKAASLCNGFNGILSPLLNLIFHATGDGKPMEPLPFDTVHPFFEYPSGIHLYGVSFNTNIAGWAFSGEYAYRPDLPLQIPLPDVVFAAEQPALPKQAIQLGALGIPLGVLPAGQVYFPSYLMRYRGQVDANGASTIQAHQYIPGYERFQVGQLDLTALKAIPNGNWFAADQIVLVTELGFTQIFNLPDHDRLQLETGDLDETHASPGADGTGGTTNPDGTPYTLRNNPTQQTTGFGQSFAWGMRVQARFEYDNIYRNISWKPQILLQQDFSGVAPSPVQNFIGGRTQLTVDNQFSFTPALSAQLIYQMITGGGRVNTLEDRDTIGAVLSYDF